MSRSTAFVVLALCLGASRTVAGQAPSHLRFREVSDAWGLVFHHHTGASGRRYMPETIVGGVVLFDYDGDGDLDVFFVDGGSLPGYTGPPARSRLFRNDGPAAGGGTRFVDVTDRSGLRVDHYGCGGVSGDVDGDGAPDLYVTELGANQLYRNRGDGTFEDVTSAAGVGDPAWSGSAEFFDADRDGDLDLYVANYVDFTIATHHVCGDTTRGIEGYCQPDAYPATPDRFYRNRGDGTFEDATRQAGFTGSAHPGLGVVAGDLDGDGWPDLYVANDQEPNSLFRNRGDGTFEDESLLSGASYGHEAQPEAGMGTDLGDPDGDGRLDIVVTNFEFETNVLYHNSGGGLFLDARFTSRLAEPSLPMLAFGVAFADLDQDGDEDLVIADGHIQDQAAKIHPQSHFAQPNQVLENVGGGRFELAAGTGLDRVRVSRGLAVGDLDGDGDQDVVIVDSNDLAEVYENLAGSATGNWLQLDLRGRRSDGQGVGARLELRSGDGPVPGPVQLREVKTGSSYLSQSSITAHLGLGDARSVDRLTVRWPGGKTQVFESLPANRRVVAYEGE